MTNLEHYGFNNLIFDEYGCVVEIYYKTKHSKDNILLIRRAPDDPREFKVKWLLKEYEPPEDNTGPWLIRLDGLYRMKHTKWR